MTHINEHTLELYVLNASEIHDRKSEIQNHLNICHGCQGLVDQMIEFHSSLEFELQQRQQDDISVPTSIIRSRHNGKTLFDAQLSPVTYDNVTVSHVMQLFIRRHPVAITMSMLGTALAVGFFLNLAIWKFHGPSTPGDTNPMFPMYNIESSTLEILNKDDQLLWQAKIADARDMATSEAATQVHYTLICDLHGNGNNDVLTTVSLLDIPDVNGHHLRIFDGKRNLLGDFHPKENVPYKDRINEYSPYFNLSYLLTRKLADGKSEIFVFGSSLGRSPSVMFRLDSDGHILGEYWHFGQFSSMVFKDLRNSGTDELIAGGSNDTKDISHEEFPMITILRPDAILGQKKATACRNFLLNSSDAEIFYIELPRSDLDTLYHTHGIVARITENDEHTLEATVVSGVLGGTHFDFHYYFDHAMRLLRVKSNNNTDALHQNLVDENKLKGRIDPPYLNNLKNQIRYWNGKAWVSEVTEVHQTSVVAIN